ncbi:MLP-like protein 28 [Neltuma alba]|uniref:MLP-like protein 28 n=2 Tax=Neltuma alba TaxID=207710 RepID=UPI0010A301BA|nr:MLP-like protein 28 [Prosopis alba]
MAHLVGKLEADVHINASAEKFHEMFSSNPHHIANVTPGKIKAVTKHQGRFGEVGSVLVWNYVLDGKTCVAKTVIEATDPAKNSITLKITEGDVLEHLKSFKATMQAIPKEKGSVVHWTFEYEKLQGQIPDPHSLMQLASEVSRDIDSHLTQGQDDHEEQLLGKVEVDVHIDASADKFHELFTSKPHHIPNISPANIQHAVADANWGKLGSLITWHYVHEGKNCVAKEKIHAVDASKNLITFRVVEGDILKDFKSMDITLQATPKDKGSLVHVTMEYEKLKGHIPDPHTLTKFATDVVRDVGSHLAL